MPMLIAPLRFTFAFSSSITRGFGLASLARMAAIGPPVTPPMTSRSVSIDSVVTALGFIVRPRWEVQGSAWRGATGGPRGTPCGHDRR